MYPEGLSRRDLLKGLTVFGVSAAANCLLPEISHAADGTVTPAYRIQIGVGNLDYLNYLSSVYSETERGGGGTLLNIGDSDEQVYEPLASQGLAKRLKEIIIVSTENADLKIMVSRNSERITGIVPERVFSLANKPLLFRGVGILTLFYRDGDAFKTRSYLHNRPWEMGAIGQGGKIINDEGFSVQFGGELYKIREDNSAFEPTPLGRRTLVQEFNLGEVDALTQLKLAAFRYIENDYKVIDPNSNFQK